MLGRQTGTNLVFKTEEKRRLTDFSAPTAPQGVFLNGSPVTGITDFPEVGQFSFPVGNAPGINDTLEATYYTQWFIDSELDGFITEGVEWIQQGSVDTMVDGLKPAVLNYAVAQAYEKLALLWAENTSVTFRLEDQPDPKQRTPAQEYTSLAKYYRKVAVDSRNDYYTRQGKSFAPTSAVIVGRVVNPVPRR